MSKETKTVVVGTLGAGYAAYLHGNGYEKVSGVNVRLKTVCDIKVELAEALKERFGYEQVCSDYDELLADPEIDVVDILTPPFNHVQMAIKAMGAGKDVICEKPLTGYFGKRGEQNVGNTTPKAFMYQEVLRTMEELRAVMAETGRKLLYAENFVYATPVQKAAEIIRAKKSKILYMKGEESLKGSSSAVAGEWNKTGGGIFRYVRFKARPQPCGLLRLRLSRNRQQTPHLAQVPFRGFIHHLHPQAP